MSERYRKTESEVLQMPGAPADQNIRMKQKIIDFDEGLGRLIGRGADSYPSLLCRSCDTTRFRDAWAM